MKGRKVEKMKKVIAMITAMVLAVSLTACAKGTSDEALTQISQEDYQQLMSNMGIKGMESVADNVIARGASRSKIDSHEYDSEDSVYYALLEICGEKKTDEYTCTYALGENQEQALESVEKYKSYLQEQGYEHQEYQSPSEYGINQATFYDIYKKGSSVVMVRNQLLPIKEIEQYGTFVNFY